MQPPPLGMALLLSAEDHAEPDAGFSVAAIADW
jgi:hypothetical protein